MTGQVWPEFAIDYAEETGEDLGDVHDRERWLYVGCEGSRDGYRDMEDFIAGLEANREIERTFCPRRSEAMEHFVASETSSTAGPRIANASSVSARSASVDERALGSRQPALPQIRQRVRAGRTNLLGSGGGLPLFEPDHRIAKRDTYPLRPTTNEMIVDLAGGSSRLGPASQQTVRCAWLGFQPLGASDPIQDGVPVRTCERLKGCLSARIGN